MLQRVRLAGFGSSSKTDRYECAEGMLDFVGMKRQEESATVRTPFIIAGRHHHSCTCGTRPPCSMYCWGYRMASNIFQSTTKDASMLCLPAA